MEKTQAGDTQALAELVRRYEKMLFGYAMRITHDREMAADIFQETFMKVFQRRSTYKVGSTFKPWLYRICLNLCRDRFRKRSRRPEVELNDHSHMSDPAPGPDEVAEKRRRGERVRQAIANLSDKHREVLILAQYQSLSYPEISEVLGIPVGTVKSRVHFAIKKLAEDLQDLRQEISS